ncbi:MAG TPA: hypothetical protein DCL86_01440 [Bacteroidales bacterium]|nr:hypothetical protein [Bacteroidales bacterium]
MNRWLQIKTHDLYTGTPKNYHRIIFQSFCNFLKFPKLCLIRYTGCLQDKCLLYVFRCTIYYAETPEEKQDVEKLKWWNWKQDTLYFLFSDDYFPSSSSFIRFNFKHIHTITQIRNVYLFTNKSF